jgi:alpha-L-fucosidase 2
MHKAAMWARLFKGDEAMALVEAFIKTHVWPSGLSSINAGDKFQIDANLGMPAVLCEMLLQSHTDELHLLPALPSAFPKGSVFGIRGRGGFLVDLAWDNRELTRAMIHSTMGKPCKVRYGDKTATLNIEAGGSVLLDGNLRIVN